MRTLANRHVPSRRRFIGQLGVLSAATLLASRLRLEAASAKAPIPGDILYTSAARIVALIRAKKTPPSKAKFGGWSKPSL